jgi:hypothetical protein
MMLGIRRMVVLLALAAGIATAALAQEKTKKAAAKPPDEKAMMEAWEKASTPGEMHRKLEPIVGTFDARVRSWMDPAKPPEDTTGTSVNGWTLGNRFVEQKYEGTMMGQPFTGMGYVGYNNVKKKYESVWMDSMGTGMMWSVMTPDASGKVMTAKTSVDDPMTGKPMPIEEKITVADNDHHKFEMWGQGPDGKKFKMMEIEYTRKK